MSGEDGEKQHTLFSKAALGALLAKVFLGVALPIIIYIVLQTVSKPYYIPGQKWYSTDGSETYQTIFVNNPGPWATRHPEVEFSAKALIEVVDSSPGVSTETKANRTVSKLDAGLAPGCSFFVTCKSRSTNTVDVTARVVCDGKQCKPTSTFDQDVMLSLIVLAVVAAFLITAFSSWGYFQVRDELLKEKSSTISKAITELITRCNAQMDVTESVSALAEFIGGKAASNVKSKGRPGNGQKGKQPKQNQNQNPPKPE